MKKLVSVFLILMVACMMITGCAESRTLDGVTYSPKGFFNSSEMSTNVHYELSVGNIIWSIVTVETLFIPVVLCGTGLWEPICLEKDYIQGM